MVSHHIRFLLAGTKRNRRRKGTPTGTCQNRDKKHRVERKEEKLCLFLSIHSHSHSLRIAHLQTSILSFQNVRRSSGEQRIIENSTLVRHPLDLDIPSLQVELNVQCCCGRRRQAIRKKVSREGNVVVVQYWNERRKNPAQKLNFQFKLEVEGNC